MPFWKRIKEKITSKAQTDGSDSDSEQEQEQAPSAGYAISGSGSGGGADTAPRDVEAAPAIAQEVPEAEFAGLPDTAYQAAYENNVAGNPDLAARMYRESLLAARSNQRRRNPGYVDAALSTAKIEQRVAKYRDDMIAQLNTQRNPPPYPVSYGQAGRASVQSSRAGEGKEPSSCAQNEGGTSISTSVYGGFQNTQFPPPPLSYQQASAMQQQHTQEEGKKPSPPGPRRGGI